jgi:hypothetical protein
VQIGFRGVHPAKARIIHLVRKKTYSASGRIQNSQSKTVAYLRLFPLKPLNTLKNTKACPTSSIFVWIKDLKNTGMEAIPNKIPIIIIGILKNEIHEKGNAIRNAIRQNK